MSEMDRLEAIEKAVLDCGKLATGRRTQQVDKVLALKLTTEQLTESWAKELLHRRALFITALRESQVWPP